MQAEDSFPAPILGLQSKKDKSCNQLPVFYIRETPMG